VVEEHDGVLNQVSILVSPSVPGVKDEEVVGTVLAFLGADDKSSRMMSDLWAQGRTVRIVRQEPYMTQNAKIPPLRVLRK
jgi:hypothetical protein